MDSYEKRGYLNQDFRLFCLKEQLPDEIGYHYHEFDKIIIFLKGDVDYIIEGRTYHLNPYDIIFVRHHSIHRPVIRENAPYERIIVYLSPDFTSAYKTASYDLNHCFAEAREHSSDVLQLRSLKAGPLFHSIVRLKDACADVGYAGELYRKLLFLEFMIHLNRAAGEEKPDYKRTSPCDEKVLQIMRYLYENPAADFSIEELADRFYLSRYHMMRLFKQQTGYTINSYINEKRLLKAKELLQQEHPVTETCYSCGFKNYSAFLRAYKKMFGETPREFKSGGN